MDSLACQAASVPPAVSATMGPTATGGRPQSPAPTYGLVSWSATAAWSAETTSTIATTGSLLAASLINCVFE